MAEITVSLASEDITDDVLEVSTISRSTSYPVVAETQPGTTQLTLSDADGNYSPENDSNFFTDNSQNQNGTRCPVVVQAGSKTLFDGEILEVVQHPTRARVTLKCIDRTRPIRIEDLTDFGIAKAWKLIQDTSQGITGHGVYPLTLGVGPVSEGSATVSKALNQEVDIVSEVRNSGVLSSDNIQIADAAVISEGGPIDVAAGGAYPQISAKVSYRYKTVIALMNAILAHYMVDQSDRFIEIPTPTGDLHPESLGRPGYDTVIGNIGSSNHLSWGAYVTDILVDSDSVYIAYSVVRGRSGFSRVLVLDTAADTWETLYTLTDSEREIWLMEKIGNNLIFLANDVGTYNDVNAGNDAQILYFDVTVDPPSVGTLVAADATLKPQIANFYQAGSASAYADGGVLLPDTRRRLLVHNNELYYGYAREDNSQFGVAKIAIGGSPSSVFEVNSDGNFNHAAYAYFIDSSGVVYFGATFLSGGESTLKVVKSS